MVAANLPTEPIGRIPDPPTSRETAFAKIRARVLGTAQAAEIIGAA